MTTTAFYSPPLSSLGGSVQAPTYVIFQIGGTIYAQSSAGSGFQAYSGTDAATVIQNAINALATTGGTIFIRAGTYTIQTPVHIENSNIHLIGEGIDATILKAGSSLVTYPGTTIDSMLSVAETTSSVISNVSIESMTVDGSPVVPNNLHVVLGMAWFGNNNGPNASLFYRVKVLPFSKAGTYGVANSFSTASGVGNIWREVLVDGSGLSSGIGNLNNSMYGFGVFADLTMYSCTAQNLAPGPASTATHNIGFELQALNLVALYGCLATNVGDGYSVDAGKATLVGCQGNTNLQRGFSAGAYGCSLVGCQFINNGQSSGPASTTRVGLAITQGSDTFVYGCDCRDTQSTHTQQYGISVVGNSTGKTTIAACVATGNVQAAVYLDGVHYTAGQAYVTLNDIDGFTPVSLISKPFIQGTVGYVLSPTSSSGSPAAAPAASQDYVVAYVPVLLTSTGGTGVSISIKDNAGNIIQSGLATLTQQYIPVGYKINFGAFSGAPTVTVWGLGD